MEGVCAGVHRLREPSGLSENQPAVCRAGKDAWRLDEKAQRRWLRDWNKLVVAQPVDKKGEKPGVEIAFAALTAE